MKWPGREALRERCVGGEREREERMTKKRETSLENKKEEERERRKKGKERREKKIHYSICDRSAIHLYQIIWHLEHLM